MLRKLTKTISSLVENVVLILTQHSLWARRDAGEVPKLRLLMCVDLCLCISSAARKGCGGDGLSSCLQVANKPCGQIISILAISLVIALSVRNELIGLHLLKIVVRSGSLNDDCLSVVREIIKHQNRKVT